MTTNQPSGAEQQPTEQQLDQQAGRSLRRMFDLVDALHPHDRAQVLDRIGEHDRNQQPNREGS